MQDSGFFSELGFALPPFPYVAHSLGWTAENMERNVNYVASSKALLRDGAGEMVRRALATAESLLVRQAMPGQIARGGRKAYDGARRG